MWHALGPGIKFADSGKKDFVRRPRDIRLLGNSAGQLPSVTEYFRPEGFGVWTSHKRSAKGRAQRRGSESSEGSAAPPKDGKKKKLTDKGLRVKSVPVTSSGWSDAEDISDIEMDGYMAKVDESMEADNASLRMQASTVSSDEEPMEVGQDEHVVTSRQDEIINTNDSDEERMAPDVVFDPRFKGPEPISPATEEALLTIVEDETVATNISSVHSETDVPSSQSSTAEIRSEINLIQLDVEPEAATASCTPREGTVLQVIGVSTKTVEPTPGAG